MTGTGGGGGRLEEVVDDGVLLLMSNLNGKYEDRTDLISQPRISRDRGTFTEDVLGLAGTDTFVAAATKVSVPANPKTSSVKVPLSLLILG